MTDDLTRNCVPIVSGLTPTTGGRLSRERAADLDRQLRALADHRGAAFAAILHTDQHDSERK